MKTNSVSKTEIIARIKQRPFDSKITVNALSFPRFFYAFLTPPNFNWESYSDRIDKDFRIYESPQQRNQYLIFAILFFALDTIFSSWFFSNGHFQLGYVTVFPFTSVLAIMLYKYLRKPPLLLQITDDVLCVKGKKTELNELTFAYFRYLVRVRISTQIVFVFQNGETKTLNLERLGYTPDMLGRIVYTKMKLAEKGA